MDNWLKNNNVLKAVSIILAIMLWMVVSLDTTTTPRANIPIEPTQNTYFYKAKVEPIYNDSEFVVDMQTKQIDVTLRGNNDIINQIRNGQNIDNGNFFVELSKYKEGKHEVPIEYSGFPKDLEIEISPNLANVIIEAKTRKEMDILVDKLGKEAEGYKTGDPIIKPKKVHISGTKEQVNKVSFIKAFVNIEQAKEPIIQQIPLRAIDKNGNEIDIEIIPQTVEIQLPVTSPYTTVPITYTIDNYPREGFAIESIEQNTKEITLYGPIEVIKDIDVYTGPSVDLANIKESKKLELKVPIASGLLKTEPDFIELDVRIASSVTKTIENVAIEFNGLSENLTAELIEPTEVIGVTIEGAESLLKNIDHEDIQAYIDLTNLPQGDHEVPVKFNVPLFTKLLDTDIRAKVKIIKE